VNKSGSIEQAIIDGKKMYILDLCHLEIRIPEEKSDKMGKAVLNRL
jgi:hypothetical protein